MICRSALLAILVCVNGCAAISSGPDFCAVYKPVPTMQCGTEYQKLVTDQNNAVYLHFCLPYTP